jgi:hypothetical protein
MGDPTRGLMAMSLMMRCADLVASRDLERSVQLHAFRDTTDDEFTITFTEAAAADPTRLGIRPAA